MSSQPMLERMRENADAARLQGLRVTCYMFGPLGVRALCTELRENSPMFRALDVNEDELAAGPRPRYVTHYGGFECWFVPIGYAETLPGQGPGPTSEGFTWMLAGTVSDVR